MKYITAIVFCFCLLACQDVKRPEMPANLIPEDKMVEIMTEVYLINAARSIDNRIIIEKKLALEKFVYLKYGIDSTQFAESNAYYTSDLGMYNKLFLKVEERMVRYKKEVDSLEKIRLQREEAQRKQDSIDGVKVDSVEVTPNLLQKKPKQNLIDPQEALLP